MEMHEKTNHYGTFNGVFVPTIISILGVIMYLRQGWVVGNAGLLGTWLIIVLSVGIALLTAFSLSSIATNTRLQAGGAYAIISRSLGLEAGACIGMALYLAQSFAITMYLFGFREGWLAVFPTHNPFAIDVCSFLLTFGIALWSTNLANRVQYVVLAITALSLVCIAMGPWQSDPSPIVWYGDFASVGGGYDGFWTTFAVFFPAVTGIMAGANMSGELKEPRKSIPWGTILAVIISALIYLWLAWVMVQMGSPQELRGKYDILVEKSMWSPVVQLAILCATSSSALVTMVGAPRILQALAQDGLLPRASWLSLRNDRGEPQNATIFTGLLVFLALGFRDLNLLAPVITICFLTTYASINFVVLLEQGIGLISFRPRLHVPLWVSGFGALGSLFAMLVINPSLSIFALAVLLLSYALMTKRGLDAQGDVRGNIFLALAQWVAREASDLPRSEARAWIPHPMFMILDEGDHVQSMELAIDLAHPRGSIKILGISAQEQSHIQEAQAVIRKKGLFCSGTSIQTHNREEALLMSMQVLRGGFFRPNILCLNMRDSYQEHELQNIVQAARRVHMGIILGCDKELVFGGGEKINVWVRSQEPDWKIEEAQKEGNLDLSLLLAIQLAKRHKMSIRLLTLIHDASHQQLAHSYLKEIIEQGRLPKDTLIEVLEGDFWDILPQASHARVQVFGMPVDNIHVFVERITKASPVSNLFVRSSGMESVLL